MLGLIFFSSLIGKMYMIVVDDDSLKVYIQ